MKRKFGGGMAKKKKLYRVKILNHETEVFLIEATSKEEACEIGYESHTDWRIASAYETVKVIAERPHPDDAEHYKNCIVKAEDVFREEA